MVSRKPKVLTFREQCQRRDAPCSVCDQRIKYSLPWDDPMSFTAHDSKPMHKACQPKPTMSRAIGDVITSREW